MQHARYIGLLVILSTFLGLVFGSEQHRRSSGPNSDVDSDIRDIEMSKLISMPLVSFVQSQLEIIKREVTFLFTKAFDGNYSSGYLTPKMVAFRYETPGNETSPPETRIQFIPQVLLYPISAHRASELELDMNLKVTLGVESPVFSSAKRFADRFQERIARKRAELLKRDGSATDEAALRKLERVSETADRWAITTARAGLATQATTQSGRVVELAYSMKVAMKASLVSLPANTAGLMEALAQAVHLGVA